MTFTLSAKVIRANRCHRVSASFGSFVRKMVARSPRCSIRFGGSDVQSCLPARRVGAALPRAVGQAALRTLSRHQHAQATRGGARPASRRRARAAAKPLRAARAAQAKFQEYFDRWWAARRISRARMYTDASRARLHVLPHWAGWRLCDIRPSDIDDWVAGLSDLMGPTSVRHCYTLFRGPVRRAVKDQIIRGSDHRHRAAAQAEDPKELRRRVDRGRGTTLRRERRRPRSEVREPEVQPSLHRAGHDGLLARTAMERSDRRARLRSQPDAQRDQLRHESSSTRTAASCSRNG